MTNFPIVPYADILAAAEAVGLRCVYPNGAAFAPAGEPWAIAGWVTGDDATVRPQLRDRTTRVAADALPRLTADAVFGQVAAEKVWLAPVHHWAAELDHGTDAAGGSTADLFPPDLRGRRQADAIELADPDALATLLADLLPRLWKTDFTLLLPGHAVVATLHHHRQVWWRCAEPDVAEALLRPS